MNKKCVSVILLAIGFILIGVSIVLTIIALGNVNIIGGADFPTLFVVFLHGKKGLYSTLAFSGIISLGASAVVRLRKSKQ